MSFSGYLAYALLLAAAAASALEKKKLSYAESVLSKDPASSRQAASDRFQSTLQCYEYYNQQGDSVKLITGAPYLGNYNFDNRARSCCFNGIWVLYDDYNYNQYSNKRMYVGWGDHYCTNLGDFSRRASSARDIGPPDGFRYDTLNLYAGEYFSGEEKFYYGNVQYVSVSFYVNSVIITGCSPWTLYDQPNYYGNSYCLYPSDTSKCNPGFYRRRADYHNSNTVIHVKSARKGCYSRNSATSREIENAFTGNSDAKKIKKDTP